MKVIKVGVIGLLVFWGSLLCAVMMAAGGGSGVAIADAGTNENRAAELPPDELIWPVEGPITEGFGMRQNPFPPYNMEMHWGIDIGAPEGTPVHTATDGKVTWAGWIGNYGNLVVVAGVDGLVTYYAHLSVVGVVQGQEVVRGGVLGAVGSTGRSTGPHLHFEVRPNGGTPVNPTKLLAAGHL